MKRWRLFGFIFFAVLLLFVAIDEMVMGERAWLDTEPVVMQVADESTEDCQELHNHKVGLPNNTYADKNPETKKNADVLNEALHKEPTSENISFNFVYYILYKFKYIDIFELVRPPK